MISGEAPIIFSKACELFILELTLRSWALTESDNRRTLQRNDIINAASQCEMYDFLIDVIPKVSNQFKGIVEVGQDIPSEMQENIPDSSELSDDK